MQPTPHDMMQVMCSLFLQHEPASYARMTRPGANYKYYKVKDDNNQPVVPTKNIFTAHLTGAETFAVPLIGQADLSYHVALDIDHGGLNALQRALTAAQALGWIAYAVSSLTNDHSGGHVWIHLDQPAAPARARQLAAQIERIAQLGEVEKYPTKQTLRIPFGRHTHTKQRGYLLLQDGRTINLDTSLATVHEAIALVAALPRNSAAKLPELPAPPHPTHSQTRQEPLGMTDNPIHEYNQGTDLVALLESYGGRIAEQPRSGKIILHCPCGQHKNRDHRPSLEVQPARRARYGRAVAVGHAPGCLFYTEQRQVIDAFSVYCKLEGVTPKEALQRLKGCRAPAPPQRNNDPTTSGSNNTSGSEPPPLPPAATPSYDTAQTDHRQDTRELHAAIRTRADADSTLLATTHRVLDALLLIADERDWCRPSKPRIAAMLGVSTRTVQRAFIDLEHRQYIATDELINCHGTRYRGGRTTPIRRFLRGTPAPSPTCATSPVVNKLSESLTPTQNTCEGAAETCAEDAQAEGASYHPAEDWTAKASSTIPHRAWRGTMRPREIARWRGEQQARSAGAHSAGDVPSAWAHVPEQQVQHELTSVKPITASETDVSGAFPRSRPARNVHHAGPQVRPQPPSDPQRRKEYAKLLGKAKRVERTSPRQAAYLRARARQFEEVLISAPAPASEELTLDQADCPAMWRTPQARGLVPVQLMLPNDDRGATSAPPSQVHWSLLH